MSMSELVIGMVILAIVGMALTGTLRSQARYFDHQKTGSLARAVSRGPINRIVSDLRMVEAKGGVVSASSTDITVRVPYAMGVVCGLGPNSTSTHVSLLPVDSAMYAAPGYSGYAWRGGDGPFRYKDDNNTKFVGDLSVCTNASIATLTAEGAKVIKLTPPLPDTASYGTPVFLYRKIRYRFQASGLVPGATGLWRKRLDDSSDEELSAPYDASAKFRFFVNSSTVAQDNPPADLSTIRGIELNMTGMSERAPRGGIEKQKAPFITAVFFKNRLD
jgi:hypothetical protein